VLVQILVVPEIVEEEGVVVEVEEKAVDSHSTRC